MTAKNTLGSTPMHVAASYGKTSICEWLYEKGGAEESIEQMG